MSIIGIGIVVGVVNTGQTAKQQASTSSGREASRADSAHQTDKFTLTQLHDAGATRDADQEMPDQQAPGYENLYGKGSAENADEQDNANDQIHDADAPAGSETDILLPPSYAPSQHPLFHAIDLKA